MIPVFSSEARPIKAVRSALITTNCAAREHTAERKRVPRSAVSTRRQCHSRISPNLLNRVPPRKSSTLHTPRKRQGQRATAPRRGFRSRAKLARPSTAKRPRPPSPRLRRTGRSAALMGGSPLFERPDFRTSPVADSARMRCARRADGSRRARPQKAQAGLPVRLRRRPVARVAGLSAHGPKQSLGPPKVLCGRTACRSPKEHPGAMPPMGGLYGRQPGEMAQVADWANLAFPAVSRYL